MRVLQGILLSLLIHFFVAWSAQFAPLIAPHFENKNITVDIVEKDPSQNETKKDARQIVRETPIPDEAKAPDSEEPADYLSAQRQRVKKQTRAAANGMTKNRSGEPANPEKEQTPTPTQEPQRKQSRLKLDPLHGGTLEALTPKYKKVPKPTRQPTVEPGISTLGEALPSDVSVGSFTALNTDRYLYYSFFSRIEEMIRFRWESSVQTAIETVPPDRFAGNTSGVWTTHLEVWLKRNGEVDSTHLMKESGFRGFDQAAIQAFMQARMFPNPPEEMVESDGLIHLKYSFQVRYEPKVVSRSRE